MKRIGIIITLIVVAGAFAVLSTAAISAQESTEAAPDSVECSLPFEATVYSGPNAELSLVGDLALTVDATGSASGTMTTNTGSDYPVVGQINGRAINLAFDLGDEVYIFGVGTAFEDMGAGNCGKALGGPFVGPAPDDSGTWLAGTALTAAADSAS